MDSEDFPEQPLPDGVEPIPFEPLRFRVRSRSSREPWLVDLESWGFNGECGCQNWNFVHGPKLRQDALEGKPPRRRRCWHLKRAFEYKAEVDNRITARHQNGQPA
jgi:hypothetical protein